MIVIYRTSYCVNLLIDGLSQNANNNESGIKDRNGLFQRRLSVKNVNMPSPASLGPTGCLDMCTTVWLWSIVVVRGHTVPSLPQCPIFHCLHSQNVSGQCRGFKVLKNGFIRWPFIKIIKYINYTHLTGTVHVDIEYLASAIILLIEYELSKCNENRIPFV